MSCLGNCFCFLVLCFVTKLFSLRRCMRDDAIDGLLILAIIPSRGLDCAFVYVSIGEVVGCAFIETSNAYS